jgi:hypothetical protein
VNLDELHDELVRMGRRPVPAPRPEFVKSLLERIQLSEDLPTPEPIQLARRQPWARLRMVAVGAIAAAALSAVGVFSLLRDSGNRTSTVISASPVKSSESAPRAISVSPDGEVNADDGTYDATCPAGDPKIPTVSGEVPCHEGDTLTLYIRDHRIEALDVSGAGGNEAAQPGVTTTSSSEGAATTAAPVTTVAPPPSTTVPPGGNAVASVVTTPGTVGTTPTTNRPDPVATPAPSTPTTTVSPSFELPYTLNDDGVTLQWPVYPGGDFGRYIVLRTSSLTNLVETPAYTPDDHGDVVAEITARDQTTFTQVFENSLPVNTLVVLYRVAVLDKNGKLVALSTTTSMQLEWKLKPSADLPPTSSVPPTTAAGPVEPGKGASEAPVGPTSTSTTAQP